MAYLREELKISFIKIHPQAIIPKAAHEFGDAGFDLYAVEDITLPPGEVTMVSTGLQLADCPLQDSHGDQYFLDIRSRSGLARKLVFPVTGTVDVNYRGEMMVVLGNLGKEPYHVVQGERVAQLVIQKIVANSPMVKVCFEETNLVTETERGSNGFGSTGKT